MRLMPILTAIIVAATLYLLIFERDRVLGFAGSEPAVEEVVEEEAPDDAGRVAVVALRSEASKIDGAVILRGRTEAARQVDVRAETTGQMVSEPLRAGAFVEEGDLLCRLDPGTREDALAEARARLSEAEAGLPTAEARLAEAEARLAEAEINDNAASRLSEGGFASETRVASANAATEAALAGVQSAKSGVEGANAAIRSAEAAVAGAERELTRLEITAPFAGILETDTAELGSLLQPGSACATIVQLDPIKLVGFVSETEVDRVEQGALAGARLASGREVTGRVTFISRSADEATRTFRVDVEVGNDDLMIRDGQTAEIAIQSDGQTAHLLPQSALTLDDEGRLGVRIAKDGAALFQEVSVLRDTVDGIWVAGLPEVVDVIVTGQEFVIDGVPVDVTYEEARG